MFAPVVLGYEKALSDELGEGGNGCGSPPLYIICYRIILHRMNLLIGNYNCKGDFYI